MKVAHSVEEIAPARRAIAIGTFDGVHRGHRHVIETARAVGLTSTVVTFWPHPRTALGNRVELLTSLDRRLELIAELGVDPVLLVPAYGIYAGAAAGRRAAVSIGTNPHYGGGERRVEAFLLDFEGDLYGQRLVVELWERLRDERSFASEAELVAEIARDVERTRQAARPG